MTPLIHDLQVQEKVPDEEIMAMSKDPSLRYATFKILQAYGKENLFPKDYYTIEKAAESFLVNWLEFPTELGFAPDKIEFETIVSLGAPAALDYYVFKFRVNKPSWPAKDWMIGVCGPYHENSIPYEVPSRIFSRFNTVGSVTILDEVLWVHENVRSTLKQWPHPY